MRQPSGRALTTGPSITTRGAHSRRRAKALALQQGGEGAARGEARAPDAAGAKALAEEVARPFTGKPGTPVSDQDVPGLPGARP